MSPNKKSTIDATVAKQRRIQQATDRRDAAKSSSKPIILPAMG
jgi:hypothetical protein